MFLRHYNEENNQWTTNVQMRTLIQIKHIHMYQMVLQVLQNYRHDNPGTDAGYSN